MTSNTYVLLRILFSIVQVVDRVSTFVALFRRTVLMGVSMINQVDKQYIYHTTSNNDFKVEVLTTIMDVCDLVIDYDALAERCKLGCKNYNTKYCCPPNSPHFETVCNDFKKIVVNVLKVDMTSYKKAFHSVRMVNNVQKSIQRKLINPLVTNEEFVLENGSCRLCKQCTMIDNLPCKHPDKMRFSLEATGINVNELCITAFGFALDWHKNGKSPDYLCVVSGVLSHNPLMTEEKIINAVSQYNNNEFSA